MITFRSATAHAHTDRTSRVVFITLGGTRPAALTMPAARQLLNTLTAAIAEVDARDETARYAYGPNAARDAAEVAAELAEPQRATWHLGEARPAFTNPDAWADACCEGGPDEHLASCPLYGGEDKAAGATYWTKPDGSCSHAQTKGNGTGQQWCTRCKEQVRW